MVILKGVYSALGVECTDKGFEADIKEISGYSKSAAVEQVSDSLINEMEIYEKYISEYTDFNFFYRIEFDMNNDVIEKENYKVYLDDTDILFEEIMPKSEAELFQQGMERIETLNDTIVAEKTIDLNANANGVMHPIVHIVVRRFILNEIFILRDINYIGCNSMW